MKALCLWRYNAVTGFWRHERTCQDENNAQVWLAVFQKDEPDAAFVLARNKPAKPPKEVT